MSFLQRTSGASALGLALCLALLLSASPAAAEPALSVSFGFEPRIGGFTAHDALLEDYGFAPVGSPFLPTWGMRGRFFLDSGLFAQLSMSYGLRLAQGAEAPTTLTLTESAGGLGYRLPWGGFASLDLGFAAHTMTLASRSDGGALVYLGPVVHPRIGWAKQFTAPVGWFLAVTLGANLAFPVGRPHGNPMWEDSFRHPVLPAFTFGIESGLGMMGEAS